MRRKIFISYRRDDAKAEARSLYQHFVRTYGQDRIFMDVDSIQKGLDFTQVLDSALRDTAVMIVVMGRTWLTQQDEQGQRRLDDPNDFVRLEISKALESNLPVIPVRVDGARVPRIDELPNDLKQLTRRQGAAVSHENFDSDVRGLEEDVRRLLEPTRGRGRMGTAMALVALLAAAGAGGAYFYRAGVPATTVASTADPSKPATTKLAAVVPQLSPADREAARMRAAVDWANAKSANTLDAYRSYLRAHPDGDHRREATDAVMPLVMQRVNAHVDEQVAKARTDKGDPPAYVRLGDPRVMVLCIPWQVVTLDVFPAMGWGGSAGPSQYSLAERETIAMGFCETPRKATNKPCTCEIAHVNGKPVLKSPADWIARQLR